MISFDRPKNLNGTELVSELKLAGIEVANLPVDNGEGKLFLDIDAKHKEKAAEIVAAHNGTTVAPEPTVADKLASVGLNVDDLKSALGL